MIRFMTSHLYFHSLALQENVMYTLEDVNAAAASLKEKYGITDCEQFAGMLVECSESDFVALKLAHPDAIYLITDYTNG